jgi:hypothetical protein
MKDVTCAPIPFNYARRILLSPMRRTSVIVPILVVALAVASLHDGLDGPAHGPDPREPTRAPQARLVAYTSAQRLDASSLTAIAKTFCSNSPKMGFFKLV